MYFGKIQKEILMKAVDRGDKLRKFPYRYCEYTHYDNETVCITNKTATALYVIPKDKVYLNMEKCFREEDKTNFKTLLDKAWYSDDITLTNEVRKIGKVSLAVFEYNGTKLYVDEKLLSAFPCQNPIYKKNGGTFRRPVNSSEAYQLKNRFSIINLDNVKWYMDSADYNRRNSQWRIKFFYNRKCVHTMRFYDKRLAEEMMYKLSTFEPKKTDGEFYFDGKKIDTDELVIVSNKHLSKNKIERNGNDSYDNLYKIDIITKHARIKKSSRSIDEGRDLIFGLQKTFVR